MFESLVRPVQLLSRVLNFRQKFLLVFVISVLPGLVLLTQGAMNNYADVKRDKIEIDGARYLAAIAPVARAARDHRGATAQSVAGIAGADQAIAATEADMKTALDKLNRESSSSAFAAAWQPKLSQINKDWAALQTGWRSMRPDDSFNAHSALVALINEYRHHVAGDVGLLLDPDDAAYYQVVITADELPALREALGKMRGTLVGVKPDAATALAKRGQVEMYMNDAVIRAIEHIDSDLELLGESHPASRHAVESGWISAKQEIEAIRRDVNSQILATDQIQADGASFYPRISTALDHLSAFDSALLARLTNETLVDRLKDETQQLWLRVGTGIAVMGLVGWLIIGFAIDIAARAGILKSRMQLIASGDFTTQINLDGRDEISSVGESADALIEKLGESMRNIRQCSFELMDSATDIASASVQVASSTREQSNAAASMAAAVEELTVSVSHMAENAREAHAMSDESGRVSSEGGMVINQTVESIELIAQSVRTASESVSALGRDAAAISGIVDVIKDIAGQTNLLALNAAIEAARAGETGRGFAVVADEVRKLAERTANCTREIADMISRIQDGTNEVVGGMDEGVNQVERGVDLASQAGSAIARIREGSTGVVDVVSEITNALREQSVAAHQVAGKVETIAQMSEQNSKAAESSAATANTLRRLAVTLDQQVSAFKFA
ncbi:MAG: methyl-accepting chemotaxis protein [Burkholderiales bacterium]|nr:methyl-accepting chemotaxis protein [Burkholderiales bacterium]